MGNPANRPYRSRFATGDDDSQDSTRAPVRRAPLEPDDPAPPPSRQPPAPPSRQPPGGPVRRDYGLRRRGETGTDPRTGQADPTRRTPQSRTELPRTGRPAWETNRSRAPERGGRTPNGGPPRNAPPGAGRWEQRPPPLLGREGFLDRAGLLNGPDRPARGRVPGRRADAVPSRLRSRSGTLRRVLREATLRPPRGGRRPAPVSERTARMYRRRRRSVLLALLLLFTVVTSVSLLSRDPAARKPTTAPPPAPVATGVVRPAETDRATQAPQLVAPPGDSRAPTGAVAPTAVGYPSAGANSFAHAGGVGPVLGSGGTLRRFRVAVENGIGQPAAGFAAAVDRILGDPRSWIASRQIRLQRVPSSAAAEFTIYLASPVTSERMCALGGLRTNRFTSCRLPGQVIINVARWLTAITDYGAPLVVYQAYAVNHEVGHQLGRGHESCPGPGRPAPLMQQQTYGLKGCLANPWPYLNGKRYAGRPVA